MVSRLDWAIDCCDRGRYQGVMLAIRAARQFDGEAFRDGGVTVLVENGRITAVESGFPAVGERCELVEYPDATVLPGLIDTHVHLVADSGDRALDRVAGYSIDEIDAVITDGLRRQLAAGVTTVRDLGDRRWCVVDRRDRQWARAGNQLEPTILASGPPVTSPGGHCFFLGGEVQGREAIIATVRQRAERGVDIVKVMASGGLSTPGTDVMRNQFSGDDLALLVDEAHASGLPVTAHAHGLRAVEQSLAVGVDGIEHCSCLTEDGVKITDELLETLAGRAIPIGAALGAPQVAAFPQAPPEVKAMMERASVTPDMMRAVRLDAVGRMHRAGVRFVAGSDSGISPWMAHGLMRSAVSFLVEAGASAAAGAASATSLAADACGIGDRKGRLLAGFDADILVVDGDLRTDIQCLEAVRAVVLGGRLIA